MVLWFPNKSIPDEFNHSGRGFFEYFPSDSLNMSFNFYADIQGYPALNSFYQTRILLFVLSFNCFTCLVTSYREFGLLVWRHRLIHWKLSHHLLMDTPRLFSEKSVLVVVGTIAGEHNHRYDVVNTFYLGPQHSTARGNVQLNFYFEEEARSEYAWTKTTTWLSSLPLHRRTTVSS